jgi:plasmid maintenance system antidote protein VapI
VNADDLRAEVARRDVKGYRIAVHLQCHPSKVSLLLHGKLPLTPEIAEAIRNAIEREAESA